MLQVVSASASIERQNGSCELCGLPLGRSQITYSTNGGAPLRFCCHGCGYVFEILTNDPDGPPSDFRQTEIYQACLAAGIIPRDEQAQAEIQAMVEPEEPHPVPESIQADQDLAEELTLRVEGMWCAACSWVIESVLRKIDGIIDAKVFFLSDLLSIKYLPHRVNPADVLKAISKLGYRASFLDDDSERARERKRLLIRLGVASILTFNAMMLSFVLYWGFFQDLGSETIGYFSYPLWLFATPVVFYSGYPILRKAVLGLRFGATSMETLISVGALSAYLYSIFRMLQGSIHIYFDTASMLITLVLLGKYIEMQAREKVSGSIVELYKLASRKVRLRLGGRDRWVASDAVEVGQEFRVLNGERVPVDGVIVSGKAAIDESALTGESRPVNRSVGNDVMGGTLLLEGDLLVRATRVSAESSLSQVIALMQDALTRKNPIELVADHITRWFVPGVLILAAATAAYLKAHGSATDEALLRAVTVLVITCPCALGIATPLAKVACLGVGRSKGVLIRDSAAIETARKIDVVVFDKTGTLTEGNFSLQALITDGISQAKALHYAASLEAHSDHFLAREVLRKSRDLSIEPTDAEGIESVEGLGMKGTVNGRRIAVGSRRMMESESLHIPPSLDARARSMEANGSTVIFLAPGPNVRALLIFGDRLKDGARRTVSALHARGIATWILSGDSQVTTQAVAAELGITDFRGQTLPKDKLELIQALQDQGRCVGMVGDGVNDAAALAKADVGFALGARANIIHEASDVTLLSTDPSKVLDALDLSRMSDRVTRQNLFFAFFYNVLGIPLAVTGALTPLVAVLAMFVSSLTVVGNTLRIAGNASRTGSNRLECLNETMRSGPAGPP